MMYPILIIDYLLYLSLFVNEKDVSTCVPEWEPKSTSRTDECGCGTLYALDMYVNICIYSLDVFCMRYRLNILIRLRGLARWIFNAIA